jgi:hypothetical protein
MNERVLGELLLQLDADALRDQPEPRKFAEPILKRDRRRVWWLTAASIGLWAFATVLVLGVMIGLGLLMPFKAHIRDNPERLNAEQLIQAQRAADEGMSMMLVLTAFSGVISCAAILCTLLLILSSRQATLRQVNASLLEISEQLRRLRVSLPAPS